MSFWQSYKSLTPRTRVFLGLGIITWAGIGLFVTDQTERKFNMVPTEQERKELEGLIPRVRLVEKERE
ncbi:hypothetical protein MMC30_002165 [Trapelia coarctata]|nr:hypothetical protein [Trapelia coarctata]